MKKLVLKIFCLFGIVSILCSLYCVIFFFAIPPQYIQSFQGALIDKVERLESIEGPKIILAGNSNLAFGMDSRLLEEKTGMPVVNLGLHGGLGNDFQERIARLNVQQGDIVVIANSNYKDGSIQKDLMWITVENHKGIIAFERNMVKINSRIGPIIIKGEKFEILFIGETSMTINGIFKGISYEG